MNYLLELIVQAPFMFVMNTLGTVAFALAGAGVAVKKRMDVFGVNFLALVNATAGGFIRDITIGIFPPSVFVDTYYALLALIVANCYFWFLYFFKNTSPKMLFYLKRFHFWADTLGLAAFTLGGTYLGIKLGFKDKTLLLLFMGVITGVGGGIMRDVLASDVPDIFAEKVYALASIFGSLFIILLKGTPLSLLLAFIVVTTLRYVADKYNWNLPIIKKEKI